MRAFFIFLLFVVILLAVAFYLGPSALIVMALERAGTAATQSEVAVSGVDVRLGEATASISGLSVANPQGFSASNALSLDDISVQIDKAASSFETIVLSAVEVSAPAVRFELKADGSSNIRQIQRNVESFAGSGKGASSGGGPKIIIDRLEIKSGTITAVAPGGKSLDVALPAITMNDLGRKQGGASAGEITAAVLEEVSETALTSVARAQVLDQLGIGGLGDAAKGLGDRARELFGR